MLSVGTNVELDGEIKRQGSEDSKENVFNESF